MRYALRHQRTTVIFFIFPKFSSYSAHVNIQYPFLQKTDGWDPDKHQDVFIHLVDMRYPWAGYSHIRASQRGSFPSNMFLLGYNYEKYPTLIELHCILLFCPDMEELDCMENLSYGWLDRPDTIQYRKLLDRAEGKRNLYQAPVAIAGYEGFQIFKNSRPWLRDMLKGQTSLRLASGNHHVAMAKLQLDLGLKANFTVYPVSFVQELETYRRNVGYIKKDYLGKSNFTLGTPALFPEPIIPYVILYGAPRRTFDPTNLASILGPFEWYLWSVFVTAIVCALLLTLVGGKSSDDFIAIVLAWLAPLLNQSTSIGIGHKTAIWHSVWVLLVLYINGCYLAILSSIEIAPEIKTTNETFRGLVQKKYEFYADRGTEFNLKDKFLNYGSEDAAEFLNQLPKHIREDHVTLAQSVQNLQLAGKDGRVFLKLELKAWVQNQAVAKSVLSVGNRLLKYDYGILKEKFMEIPKFVQIDIGQDVVVPRCFQLLIQCGIVGFWNEVKSASLYRANIKFWKDAAGLIGRDNDDQVSHVTLEDSLVLEAFILFAFGIMSASLAYGYRVVKRSLGGTGCVNRSTSVEHY